MSVTVHENLVLIVSKNRPLQLDLCLNGFYHFCEDAKKTDVIVVYDFDKEYEEAYKILIQEQIKNHQNSNIQFLHEKMFGGFKNTLFLFFRLIIKIFTQ